MTLSTSTVTLAPGISRTYSLAPGEAVTVATEPNCYVTVTETPDVIATADQGGQTNVRTSILQYKGHGPTVPTPWAARLRGRREPRQEHVLGCCDSGERGRCGGGGGIDRLRAAPARVFRKHSAVLFDITRQETLPGSGFLRPTAQTRSVTSVRAGVLIPERSQLLGAPRISRVAAPALAGSAKHRTGAAFMLNVVQDNPTRIASTEQSGRLLHRNFGSAVNRAPTGIRGGGLHAASEAECRPIGSCRPETGLPGRFANAR
jgi:hypothetical protein